MSKSGFNCPKCNSWDTEYIFGSTQIECNTCGFVWDPGDDDEEGIDAECPRCGCDDIDIDDSGEFYCNGCGLSGDVSNL